MSNINKKLFNRLHLNHAYGQLIALIFVPIMILACVGALLVITETSNAAKAQQRQILKAIPYMVCPSTNLQARLRSWWLN